MTTAERLEKLKSNFLKAVEGLNPDEKIVIGHGQEYKISYLIDCDVMCTEEGRIVEHKRKKYFIGHLSAGNNIGNRGHFHNEDCVSRITLWEDAQKRVNVKNVQYNISHQTYKCRL
jgi:hypothetical protein